MPQPSPTSSRGSSGSATAAALRALLSAAALIVLLAGLPLLLWWATAIVGPDGVRALGHLLSTQDSGQVFLLALAVVGWVGWGMFATSVLVEIPAQFRGRTAPQLKGLLGQRTAGALVGAIFLVLPAGTALASAAAPAHAATPAATATAQPGAVAQGSAASKPDAAHSGEGQTSVRYTVQQLRPAESLWSIAEQQLGDGNRWQEIADLNAGRTMTDGTIFQADAPIHPGWVLLLPVDARGPQKAEAATARQDAPTATEPRSYTVVPGDSLSEIAQHELGDAGKWPQIYDLNKGQPQPGGHTLTDPDLIFPREHLQLPGQSTGSGRLPASDAPAPEHHAPPASTPPAASAPAVPAPSPSGPATSVPEQTPSTGPAHAPSASPSASAPATPAPQTSSAPAATPTASPAATTTAADGTQTGSRMPLYALGGGLLAAAVLTMLGLRRRHQQRRRGIGRRIPLPTGTVAATEQALRATEQPDVPDVIDRALRTVAVYLAAAGRELPDLAAAVYGPECLELRLTEGAPPVEPFTAVDGDLTRWRCPAGSGELLAAERTDAVEAPYPALVTLGSTADGRTVLVDLEHYGMLVLTGPGRRHVLRAIAVELATSRYAEHLDVAVTGASTCPGLPPLVPEWFTQYDDTGTALRAADGHHTAQASALAALGVAGLREARLRDDQASVWTPYLLLADDTDDGTAGALAELAGRHPRTAGAVVTAGTTATTLLPPGGWLLDTAAGQVRLPDVDLTVHLQVLPDDAYSDVIALLAESDESRPDVPARPPEARPDVAAAAAAPPITAPPVAVPELHAAPHSVRVRLPESEDGDRDSASEGGAGASLDSLMASFADFEDAVEDGPADEPEPEVTAAVEPVAVLPPAPRSPEPTAPSNPLIRVLGPVDIIGASGTADTKYVRTVTEIAAWMVLHPGLDHHALDEAIWPGRDVSRKTRNPWISRLRTLLGTATDGTKYLPAIATTDDARYRFANQVTSDWQLFQDLAAKGAASSGDHADDLLRAALDMVRGRPFSGVPPRKYVWAEHLAQDMIAAIVDAAATLGERRLALADPRGALWATTKGLDVAPEAEHLYRINFRAHHALGDHEGLERAAGQLERLCDALGSDMEDATVELLRSLLASAAPLR